MTNCDVTLRRHRDDVLFRIEDIERHQKTQDLRFFTTFENTHNNTADISELKVKAIAFALTLAVVVT